MRYRRYTMDPFCVFASFWASGACCAPEMHLKCTCKASPGCRSPTCKALPNVQSLTGLPLPNVQSLTCLPLPNLQSLTCLQKPHQPAKPHLDFAGLRFRYKVI